MNVALLTDASGAQVNNATARVMTNKKMTTPYANGEGLTTLPYGKRLKGSSAFSLKKKNPLCRTESVSFLVLETITRIKSKVCYGPQDKGVVVSC